MEKKKTGFFKVIGYIFAVLGTFLAVLFLTVYLLGSMICKGASQSARKMFVSTILETGQLKFLASWYLTSDEINSIVEGNSMEKFDGEVDESLISIKKTNPDESSTGQTSSEIVREEFTEFDAGSIAGRTDTGTASYDSMPGEDLGNGIRKVKIAGRTFAGTMLIIEDPSRVKIECIYPWKDQGENLDVIVKQAGAVAGINGGIYVSSNNSGGKPIGVVVSHGQILMNDPSATRGLVLIGMNNDNILTIDNIDGMSKADVEQLVQDKGIRDACCFQEEASDKNNHFVQLIINGQEREMNGMGSGLNPRTVIGQRNDGAILMLVTDGRGTSGHLGASATDLIGIMKEYGAVNAANLDGGSSSSMYCNGEYLMTSVTFYYANASWRLPLAFVVE